MNLTKTPIYQELKEYIPYNEQEAIDKEIMLKFMEENEDGLDRTNEVAHLTASSWILNERHDKVLMVFHKIYDSWSWTGGHCDGDPDMLHVALKEASEETGIENFKVLSKGIYSIEALTVNGHIKKGKYVGSHLHYNFTYLLEAKESDFLKIKEDENTGVKWFSLSDALKVSNEPWFVERIYSKLNEKVKLYE